MQTSIFRAEASRVELTGNWDVFCLRCQTSIGTFTSAGLREAIWLTRHKQGVLCPECRAQSCQVCGTSLEIGGGSMVAGNFLGEARICWPCGIEREDEITALTEVVPCLVPHNSKTRPAKSANDQDNAGESRHPYGKAIGVKSE